jgi:tripartite-type tricarboxylate transporter receptor subunit TctC
VAAIGADIVGGRPEDYAAFIRLESAKWSKVIKDVGIKAE